MKKILLVMSVAILIALCSAPSLVKATEYYEVGIAVLNYNGTDIQTPILSSSTTTVTGIRISGTSIYTQGYSTLYFEVPGGGYGALTTSNIISGYIPTLTSSVSFTYGGVTKYIFNNLDDYYENIPPEFRPVPPSILDQAWQKYVELYESIYGFPPPDDTIVNFLLHLFDGDNDDYEDITFITSAPTPTPSPTPTPIPVQTIFVPDGNGNTTIIYQYTDPNTGVITQSPYNPNITNEVTVNCDCNDDNTSDPFGYSSPQDPYTLNSSILWGDGLGVEMSDNPLSATNSNQETLKAASDEYISSAQVVSNSFNSLPVKWLTLIGLCGGILILAGLMKTFLGG